MSINLYTRAAQEKGLIYRIDNKCNSENFSFIGTQKSGATGEGSVKHFKFRENYAQN